MQKCFVQSVLFLLAYLELVSPGILCLLKKVDNGQCIQFCTMSNKSHTSWGRETDKNIYVNKIIGVLSPFHDVKPS